MVPDEYCNWSMRQCVHGCTPPCPFALQNMYHALVVTNSILQYVSLFLAASDWVNNLASRRWYTWPSNQPSPRRQESSHICTSGRPNRRIQRPNLRSRAASNSSYWALISRHTTDQHPRVPIRASVRRIDTPVFGFAWRGAILTGEGRLVWNGRRWTEGCGDAGQDRIGWGWWG